MLRRPALVGGVTLLVMLAGGYTASAIRSDGSDLLAIRPAATVPVPPPDEVPPEPANPSPSVAAPTSGSTPKKAPPRGTVGPLDTKRMTGGKSVALTFDDGPDPTWTPKVLDRLREARVKATFCLVGSNVRRYPALVVRIVREGHSLCNHSWRHDLKLGERSEAEITADLSRTNREIRHAVPGAEVPYYRQPGGKWTRKVVKVAQEQGMAPLHWDVDPSDWAKPGAKVITKRVLGQARPGSIVLLHDGGGDRSGTLAACPEVIGKLKKKYGIVRLG